jgi:ribosomal protein L40E
MRNSELVAHCPACNYANPPDVRFCQKCGKKMILLCRRCGTENMLGAVFCKSCGVKLAEATLGIPDQRAQIWWEHFASFTGYSHMWSAKGWATTQTLPFAKQLLDASDPRVLQKGEKTALILPIANRDWCIKTVQFKTTVITHGAVWAGTTGFAIFDFSQRLAHSVPYESLSSVKHQGDTISLATHQESAIFIAIRVPRPSQASKTAGFLLDVARILGSQSVADQELASQRSEREANEYWRRVETANAFVASVLNFFSEIIKIKNELSKS